MTIPNRSAGWGRPRDFPDTRLRLVVDGYRRAPASASAVFAGAGEVEPHIERIRFVSGRETRRCRRVAGPGAYSQRAEVGPLRNTSSASGGRRGALINQWALLVGRWQPGVVVGWDRIGLARERNREGIGTAI